MGLVGVAGGAVGGGDAVVGTGLLAPLAGPDRQAERLGMAGARLVDLPYGPRGFG
jgi:hypothetical protein